MPAAFNLFTGLLAEAERVKHGDQLALIRGRVRAKLLCRAIRRPGGRFEQDEDLAIAWRPPIEQMRDDTLYHATGITFFRRTAPDFCRHYDARQLGSQPGERSLVRIDQEQVPAKLPPCSQLCRVAPTPPTPISQPFPCLPPPTRTGHKI